jgi:hypothetical protein
MQPLEVLRVGMKREFLVVEDEGKYGQIILSLAADEVRERRQPMLPKFSKYQRNICHCRHLSIGNE